MGLFAHIIHSQLFRIFVLFISVCNILKILADLFSAYSEHLLFKMKSYDNLYKLLLIGDSSVGKSCILDRFSEDKFLNGPMIPTIGIDFKIKTIPVKDKRIKLQIWDTAGQERFHSITKSYYRGALGIMLVYDITNANSSDNVAKWLKRISDNADENVQKIIIGNKCDLEDKRMVAKEKGEEIANENGICFMETSAKTNKNIEKAFIQLAEAILDKELNIQDLNLGVPRSGPSCGGYKQTPCCGMN